MAQTLEYGDFEGMFDEPVTVSATGKPERISDTPVTMDVITAADIKRSGARDLSTLLRTLPGINAYRGFNGTEPFSIGALFLNGREIYLTIFGDILLPSVPVELEEIRQIEVIRGPQSALYGFNAGEGVINIVTYDPAKDPVDNVVARGGNDSRRDGSVILTQSLGQDMGVRVTAAGDHAHYNDGAFNTLPNPNPTDRNRTNFSANFSAGLANGDRTTFELSHTDIGITDAVPQITYMMDMRIQTDVVRAAYVADTVIGRVTASSFYTAQTIPEAQTQTGGNFDLHDHTVDAKIEDLFKTGPADTLRFALEYRHEIVHTSDTDGSLWTSMVVGSAMWDHQFGHDLSLVNAVRYYRSDADSSAPMTMMGGSDINYGFAYNSSLIYKLDPDDSVRAAVARGIGLPSQLDFQTLGLNPLLLANFNRSTYNIGSDPNLTRTPSLEYRVGWDHELRDFDSMARISLFTKQSSNAVTLIPIQIEGIFLPACAVSAGPGAAFCTNVTGTSEMSGSFNGAELQIDHKANEGWRWGANYTIERLHPHANSSDAVLVPELGRNQLYQKANAYAGYGWNHWTADLRLFYSGAVHSLQLETVGNNAGANLATQKAILVLSPHLSWRVRDDITLDLAADNLWAFQQNLEQKFPPAYFLTARYNY